MAVDCISHCVSIEAPFLTTVISPFLYSWNTAVNLPLASQSAYPVLTEEQDLSFSLSLFFLHLIYIFITIIFISTCCLCELTSEQYAHVKKKEKYQMAPLRFMNSSQFVRLFYFYRTVM